jgi:hypothetical protein
VADAISDFITQNHLNNPFGGTITRSGDKRYYLIDFSRPAYLDGLVRVYSPTYVMISSRGRLAPRGDDTRIFASLDYALDFLRLAFVEFKQDQAEMVPTKEPRKPKQPL